MNTQSTQSYNPEQPFSQKELYQLIVVPMLLLLLAYPGLLILGLLDDELVCLCTAAIIVIPFVICSTARSNNGDIDVMSALTMLGAICAVFTGVLFILLCWLCPHIVDISAAFVDKIAGTMAYAGTYVGLSANSTYAITVGMLSAIPVGLPLCCVNAAHFGLIFKKRTLDLSMLVVGMLSAIPVAMLVVGTVTASILTGVISNNINAAKTIGLVAGISLVDMLLVAMISFRARKRNEAQRHL